MSGFLFFFSFGSYFGIIVPIRSTSSLLAGKKPIKTGSKNERN